MSRKESAEDLISEANSLFVDEDFEAALKKFNEAIELDSSNADYYIKRSFCHWKLENFTGAMNDAKKALTLEPNNAKAHYRKGRAAFSLEEYESAKDAFKKSNELSPSSDCKTWIRKCEAELADEENDDMDQESSDDMDIIKPSTQSGPPPLEPDVDNEPKKEKTPTLTPSNTSSTTTSTPSTAPITTPSSNQSTIPNIRHEWFQTATHVTITVFIKGAKKEQVSINFGKKTLEVSIKLPTQSEYVLDLDLADEIVPEESKYEILSTKIEIKLKKSSSSKWLSLEDTGDKVQSWTAPSETKSAKVEYPTSSKHGPKNWDKLADTELGEDKLEGDAALNKVFQDIYKGASDDQRRAMMKSFQESGGTVLSTNWSEVGSGYVKGSPPKGMEMKEWKELQQ